MKNTYKIFPIILAMILITSCTSKKSNTPMASSTSQVVSLLPVAPLGSAATSGTTTIGGISCDGINNNTGASNCYFKNIPTIQVMGVKPANAGQTIWSSQILGGSISQNQFATDEVFNVRIVPRIAIKSNPAVNPSVAGKSCNHTLTKIATKLYVQLKLQTNEEDLAGSTIGEVATLSANVEKLADGKIVQSPSNVWHFSKRVTPSHLVLKVVTVLSDSRLQQGQAGFGDASDIPLNNPTLTTDSLGRPAYPTECVAFDIQYSTDETFDLPGASAN